MFGLAWSNIPLDVAATLLKGHTVIFSDEFEPGGRIRLHERVWNENHMHAIEYALQNKKIMKTLVAKCSNFQPIKLNIYIYIYIYTVIPHL